MKFLTDNTRVLMITLMHLTLFGIAAFGKLSAPAATIGYFTKTFEATFLGPMVELSFWIIVAMQVAISALLIISLIKREFLPGNAKDWLKAGLVLGMANFIVLIFGQLIAHQNAQALQTFICFGVSVASLFYVEHSEAK